MKNSSFMAYKVEKIRTGSMKHVRDDQIVIENQVRIPTYVIILAFYVMDFLLILGNTQIVIAVFLIFIIMLITLDTLFNCRTFILRANGCTVKFFRYERTYKWEEFAIKRREYNYSKCYKDGVFFSVHPVNKPVNVDPKYYGIAHGLLFTCFYVYLEDQENLAEMRYERLQDKSWNGVRRRKYSEMLNNKVSKQKFLQKMEEWGVELTDGKMEME